MADDSAPVEELAYPCVLFDNDDWLISCADADEVWLASDPERLRYFMESYFHSWVDAELQRSPLIRRAIAAAAAEAAEITPIRRKKRKDPKG
ncbi:hypothetical protein [Kitasatospora purpeofusca]|uniref:Uncharacterized protein n=1 Tax=Kitasatospora purpeofusca TaxID=67352 RepID=A0ABZ1TWE3_9ACTN|nr:hypothetical protein [Kitasatospora purpeofusca]